MNNKNPKLRCELRSWDEMRNLSVIVSDKIKKSGYKPDVIIAVLRGGMVPAMNLSDLLGIRDILTIGVGHWGITATKNKNAELKFPLCNDIKGKKILLVDDLTDTGGSMKVCIKHLKKFNPLKIRTAVLIHKTQSGFEPDFYAEKARKWKWIILPWNVTEDLQNLIGKIIKEGKETELNGIRIKRELKRRFNLDVSRRILGKVLKDRKN